MTGAEYIARVVKYYTKERTKLGFLTFDKKTDRFVIKNLNDKKAKTAPRDGIHCGDIYIVKDNNGKWRIAQCELRDNVWKMLGTNITADNCQNNEILYVNSRRLMRVCDVFLDDSFDLGELSSDFAYGLIRR